MFERANLTMVDFTVAIPTYNGATRLPKVLERLRSQIQTEQFSWEILVVDNNSNDRTAEVIQEVQKNWPQTYPLRYIFEAEPGAAFARNRAVEAARGNLIGFLDDDNLPDADWVAAAYEFGQTHPRAGAYGSQIHGKFEGELPKDFKKIAVYLAIIERGSTASRYESQQKILPPAAGLVVRKQAWCDNVPKRLFLNHTSRDAGLASEDLEAVLYIQKAGWEIWYNPQMCMEHEIPQWRLEKEYLISVVRCIGLSRHHLRMLRLKNWQKPLAIPVYWANDLRKLIGYWIGHRNRLKEDAIAEACELELLRGILISPFFLWKKRLLESKITQALTQKKNKPAMPLAK